MPRDIPVGNGRLLVCFDQDYSIRDLFFPHVGQENHILGEYCRFGVWVDNQFSWINDSWQKDLLYKQDTLVTQITLYNEHLKLLITCNDAVDFHENVYLRKISVENMEKRSREIRLFFSHSFNIGGNNVGDTAAFDPTTGGIIHYKGARYFLANANSVKGEGISQFAVGQKGINNKEGTYKDAEDGNLSGNTIAQGTVDSVIAQHLYIDSFSTDICYYWLSAAKNWDEIHRLNEIVKFKGPEQLINRTGDYWKLWVHKETPELEPFSDPIKNLYKRSLLLVNTQIDADGGIIAANDSDVVQFNRDTYSYIWPRDGALVANALDVAGYPFLAQRFYNFASNTITKKGYFLHKYNPDGTLASSWHPWSKNNRDQLPIQEDETALVIWSLWNHFVLYRDIEFIKPLYRHLIKNAADFMCSYRDEETGLPDSSYDLWEERHGILSFTVGSVFGGLTAASLFCMVFGEDDNADKYRTAASEIRDAASTHLWRQDLNRFCRMVYRDNNGSLKVDPTCDSSLWGLFNFGMYNVDDPRIQSTMAALREALWLKTDVGGMARYENDPYYLSSPDVVGNPWFICTLWLADYLSGIASNIDEIQPALDILQWVADHALPSGVLAEQVNPLTGAAVSVSPLTWSHATFVATTQRLIRLMAEKKECTDCGFSDKYHSQGGDWLSKLYSEACNTIHGSCNVK